MDHEDGDRDGAGLDVGVDGDSRGGMEEPSGGDSGGVSPLRSLHQHHRQDQHHLHHHLRDPLHPPHSLRLLNPSYCLRAIIPVYD